MNRRKVLRDGLLHLKKQGVFSIKQDRAGSTCVYRTRNGNACIIGGIIDKGIKLMEETPASALSMRAKVKENLEKKYGLIKKDDLGFLDYMQCQFHDFPSIYYTSIKAFLTSYRFKDTWEETRKLYLKEEND